tara:strand:+ start:228 stop:1733 length:1506 start_codon:yes stop_codon:yes gene_type:complete
MIKKILYIILFFKIVLAENYQSCISSNNRTYRQEYANPQTIESEHFVIHFTIDDDDFQNINGQLYSLQSSFEFAQSILDLMEPTLDKYIESGWEMPPPDCDESITDVNSAEHCNNFGGNALYDIYISNDGVGMVVPENLYPVEPYTGGRTSFMKMSTMSNQYSTLPVWAHHVVAHELHHSIQLRYGYSVSGNSGGYMYNGWLFEQTATYMENVIFPESIHLRTMLANCDVVTPLTYPSYGINYPAEIYPYRSALWQKFLVESQGDSSIIRNIWEGYGIEYASEEPVDLFPIYNNSIRDISNNGYDINDAYKDYAIWRYFTGDRSVVNNYFDESSYYCESSLLNFENSLQDVSLSNKGGTKYIYLPLNEINLKLSTLIPEYINALYLTIDIDGNINIADLEINDLEQYLSYSSDNLTEHTLIFYSSYINLTDDVYFDLELIDYINGDINFDQVLNILDVVLLVSFALEEAYPSDIELQTGDLNVDGVLNILDVVQLLTQILN